MTRKRYELETKLSKPNFFINFVVDKVQNMAGVTGLEPATSGVTGQRSNQLSYTPAVGVALVLSNQPTEVNCITDFKHLKAKPINYAASPVSRRVEWKGSTSASGIFQW